MIVRNRFIPSGVSSSPAGRTSYGVVGGAVGSTPLANNGNGRARTQDAVAEFIESSGKSNAPFLTGAAGSLQPGDRPKIQRGFIRRSNRNAANPLSDMSLRFMYNPASIQRKYASYLDQAAIDPFNTVFQSGNLVAPPSVIEFSFTLFFDRQDEATSTGPWSGAADWLNLGVLHDYQYFDAVVRNVPPSGTPSTVPDNGVMMVNPEDITVVFSKNLTVQGRPTNSQVNFTKFNHKMVPTRMEISITLVANYFGPIKEPFGLDAKQQIAQYEALIPYDTTLGDGLANTRSVEAAIRAYRSGSSLASRLAQAALSAQKLGSKTPVASWWTTSSPATSSGGVANTLQMTGPVNGSIKLAALQEMQKLISEPGVRVEYDKPRRREHGPGLTVKHYDCGTFIWKAYKNIGAQGVFGRSEYPTTGDMLTFWQGSNWSTMFRVMAWTSPGGIADQLLLLAEPGDILFKRRGNDGHISTILGVNRSSRGFTTIAARGESRGVGTGTEPASTCATSYGWLLRPTLVGSQSIGGGL